MNPCHAPESGEFCSGSGRGPLSIHPYPKDSVKIPAYLKDDVARAARAGIVTTHRQQPEPVRDITGQIHDPLAMSNARRGEETYFDAKGSMNIAYTGRVHIVTRGGVFEPEEQTWGKYGPSGRKTKEMTPDMLTNPASVHDIVSTYRHEVGHIMDDNFKGSKTATGPLAREIRAWTYAVEIAPDHTVSERMVRSGLESHAYHEFRVQEHLNSPTGKRIARYDADEWATRQVQNESKNNFVDAPTAQRAQRLASRVVTSLARYGEVLRKKGVVRIPKGRAPYFPKRWKMGIGTGPDMYRPQSGPGGRGLL